MKIILSVLSIIISLGSIAQVKISGQILDKKKEPVSFATVLVESMSDSSKRVGTFSDETGLFEIEIHNGWYHLQIQMVGFSALRMDSIYVDSDTNLGALSLTEDVVQLAEVIVRAERSHIETELGKKTLHIGSDLTNSGATVLNAMEALPSVTTTSEGGISVRGSQNILIYVNGRETNRDPRTLQFISAESLQSIELITNPSSKYDAEGVAGIINLIYNKTISSKMEVYGNLTLPPRISGGANWSIATDKFSFFLNTNERRSRYETLIDNERLTPANELIRYISSSTADGRGLTRDITTGISYEPDSSLSIGLDVNYLRWHDELEERRNNSFEYVNRTEGLSFTNNRLEIEDEVTLSLSLVKEFRDGMLNIQLTSGGENEVNDVDFNVTNIDFSGSPITQPLDFSNETERQRFQRAKIDHTFLLSDVRKLEAGFVYNNFNFTVDQEIGFTLETPLTNLFKVVTNKYAGYIQYSDVFRSFEYSAGLRYENFKSQAVDILSDSTFTRIFENVFPSVQWKYTFDRIDHSLGFNLTRRINRPSFWELTPFISYADPLNIETGNPYILPEFAYLYELTYSNRFRKLSFDITVFRRNTQNVIQQFTTPTTEDRVLLTYRNLGTQNNDGIEGSFSLDINDRIDLQGSVSGYRTLFSEATEGVFFQRKLNWQGRLRQKIRLEKGWTIDLSQFYRARRFGVQSFSLPRYYVNAAIQKISANKRTTFSLSFSDVFDTSFFGTTVVNEDFELVSREKYQSQRLTLGVRYKIKQ